MADKIQVFYEATPNPQSMKFILGMQIADENLFIDELSKARRSPLAQKLYGFPWMSAVFIGNNFVTVTKQDWVDWSVIAEPLSDLIAEHFENGELALIPPDSMEATSDDDETVQEIKRILNDEIRPAVAMDGGDIIFKNYENDILYVELQGACSGCPSSTVTLKDGIEVRLKERIPNLKEVVSI